MKEECIFHVFAENTPQIQDLYGDSWYTFLYFLGFGFSFSMEILEFVYFGDFDTPSLLPSYSGVVWAKVAGLPDFYFF